MAFSDYIIYLVTLTSIFTILGVSFSLLLGYAGIINLGHLAFFGIAAYTNAILTLHGVPVPVAAAFSVLFVAAMSFIISIPVVRLKVEYTALATLSLTIMAAGFARNLGITRGSLGLPGVPGLFGNSVVYMVFALVALAVIAFLSYKLVNSRFGKVIQAARDDETAAKILGKDTAASRAALFVIASVMAAVAGILYVHFIRFVDPDIFGLFDIIVLLAMVIVGGLATIRGAVIGSVIVFLLPNLVRFVSLPPNVVGPLREALFAAALLLILLFRPRGLFGRVDLE